ncbi:Zinc Finger Protein Gli4 [Manis pentadactyla]|nr:Zinc Finger Protein Gli4 [Manis pentadactyla]
MTSAGGLTQKVRNWSQAGTPSAGLKMAALGDSQEPSRVPSPVNLESPGTPGAHHHKARLHLYSHQHGSPTCSPEVFSRSPLEEELSDLDLQDVEEVRIGRDTCWPDSESESEQAPSSPHPHHPENEVDQAGGALRTLLRSLPRRPKCGDSFGQEPSLELPTDKPPGVTPYMQKRGSWQGQLVRHHSSHVDAVIVVKPEGFTLGASPEVRAADVGGGASGGGVAVDFQGFFYKQVGCEISSRRDHSRQLADAALPSFASGPSSLVTNKVSPPGVSAGFQQGGPPGLNPQDATERAALMDACPASSAQVPDGGQASGSAAPAAKCGARSTGSAPEQETSEQSEETGVLGKASFLDGKPVALMVARMSRAHSVRNSAS